MNKKVKRFIGCVLVAIIVIWNIIKTPAILLPVLGLVGIILFGAGLIALLKWKDQKDANGEIDYNKILPDWLMVIVAIVVVVAVVLVSLKLTLIVGSLVGGELVAVYLIHRLEKGNKDSDE